MKNFKKKIALLSALALAGTMFAGCKKDEPAAETTTAATTTAAADDATTTAADGDVTTAAAPVASLPNTGDKLTVMTWNTEFTDFVQNYYLKDNKLPDGVTYNPVTFGVGGGDASTYFDQYIESGEDLDLFCLEADWALTYLNSDKTTSLESIGIAESELDGQYSYTKDLGRDSSGVLKASTFQACPGGYS